MDEGPMKEKETLCYIKTMLIERLKELQEIKSDDENQFAYGGENSVCGMFGMVTDDMGGCEEKRIGFRYRESISVVKIYAAILG